MSISPRKALNETKAFIEETQKYRHSINQPEMNNIQSWVVAVLFFVVLFLNEVFQAGLRVINRIPKK